MSRNKNLIPQIFFKQIFHINKSCLNSNDFIVFLKNISQENFLNFLKNILD